MLRSFKFLWLCSLVFMLGLSSFSFFAGAVRPILGVNLMWGKCRTATEFGGLLLLC
jgi:hypothetical protein